MIRVDSFKIEFSDSYIEYDANYFDAVKIIKNDEITEKLFLKDSVNKVNKIAGLKNIIINKTSKTVILEASSKLLYTSYIDSLNFLNMCVFLKNLNSLNIISLSQDALFDNQVLQIDICMNKEVGNVNKVLCLLDNAAFNKKYIKLSYDNSIVFKRLTKTRRLYFTVYDKFTEMQSNKKNKMLDIDIECFKNILRFELRLANFKLIRKYLNIKKTFFSLYDVLVSKENAIQTVFKDVFKKQLIKEKDCKDIESLVYSFFFKNYCKYDIRVFERVLKKYNLSDYLIRKYKSKLFNDDYFTFEL